MTGVFLQARLASSRLPNKALLELGGRTVVEQAMRSLRTLPAARHVLVTDAASAALLESRAAACGFDLFVGPEGDVLERFVLAARWYDVDEIVRATGDNPLVSALLARMALGEFRRREADYFGYDGPPLGTGVEILARHALERALRESTDAYDHEHVSPYLYRNPDTFRAIRILAPPAYCLPHARVTLDTAADYRFITRIYAELYDGAPIPVTRLVRWLAGHQDVEEWQSAYSSGA